jgi:CheY-like chemotaxis protein
MAKIMLVEDDTNLSEIYQARLTAEGYEIVSAHDGEEALALAAKEKPDLIISDVMMPKISGFEMLDILRNTEGLKETKVIMLTALGQADDQSRAQGLGANRYLVKSQVTLEDIVKAAQELLSGDGGPAAAPAAAAAAPEPTPTPVAAAPVPVAAPPEPQQPAPAIPVAAPPQVQTPAAAPAPAPTPVPVPTAPVPSVPIAPPAPVPLAPEPVPQPPVTPVPAAPAPAPTPPAAPPTPAPQPPALVAPAPVSPTPVAPVDTTTAADNQLVTDAVEDLEEAVQPAQTTGTDSTAPAAAAEQNAPDTPPVAPEPKASDAGNNNDNVGIAHKKVIHPIGDAAPSKPNLETLLADEERKNPGSVTESPIVTGNTQGQSAATPPPRTPHQPGHIISPETAASDSNASGGVDPNSIAL